MTEPTTPQISTTTLPARTPRVVIPAAQPSSPAQLRQTVDAPPGESTPASDKPPLHEVSVAPQVEALQAETPPKKRGRKKPERAASPQPAAPFGFRRRVIVDAPEHRFGTPGSSHEYVVELNAGAEAITLYQLPDTGSVEDASVVRMPITELRELVAWGTALLAMLDGNG